MRSALSSTLSVYKNKPFARFQRRARMTDEDLWRAAVAADQGVTDADLGGGVVKQRIARAGGGKSGGSRAIILLRQGRRAVFVYGFEKKDRAAIKLDELEAFRELASVVLGYPDAEIVRLVAVGALLKVEGPQEKKDD